MTFKEKKGKVVSYRDSFDPNRAHGGNRARFYGKKLINSGVRGQAATKPEAIADSERAIDRALAPKKLRLVRPDQEG